VSIAERLPLGATRHGFRAISLGARIVTDTGLFYLLDVVGLPTGSTQTTVNAILSVRAECLTCHHTMEVAAPRLVNIPGGGAVLDCPVCRTRQAISGARFAAFIERFPDGASSPRTDEPHHAPQGR
jgi:hypothetical protein